MTCRACGRVGILDADGYCEFEGQITAEVERAMSLRHAGVCPGTGGEHVAEPADPSVGIMSASCIECGEAL